MTRPKIYMICLWGAIALVALLDGIAFGAAGAWRLQVALVPPLIVFVWWMADRAALERRIRRLEARSEIIDERRVAAHVDLTNVEHRLVEIETSIALDSTHEAGARRPGASRESNRPGDAVIH